MQQKLIIQIYQSVVKEYISNVMGMFGDIYKNSFNGEI